MGMLPLTGREGQGAGKSLLIDSLKCCLVLELTDLIRYGASEATVEGEFIHLNEALKALLLSMDFKKDTLVIKREINKNNKNVISINQKNITLNELKKLLIF